MHCINDTSYVIEMDPEDKVAYHLRGLTFKILGETELAQNDFDKCNEIVKLENMVKQVESVKIEPEPEDINNSLKNQEPSFGDLDSIEIPEIKYNPPPSHSMKLDLQKVVPDILDNDHV